jgi:hypothetical protein
MDVALAIDALVPAAQYRGSVTANTEQAYQAIVWLDERPKPTWAAVEEVTLQVTFPPVTPRQIRLALNQLGLRSAVEAYVAQADQSTMDSWEYSTQFERDHPLLLAAAEALQQPPEAIDALFTLALTK